MTKIVLSRKLTCFLRWVALPLLEDLVVPDGHAHGLRGAAPEWGLLADFCGAGGLGTGPCGAPRSLEGGAI